MDYSLFGRLPAELRNAIYEYSLQEGHDGPENIYIGPERSDDMSPCKLKVYQAAEDHSNGSLLLCGLPATCKQLRRETLALYYSLNRFHFQTEYLKSDLEQKDLIIKRVLEWAQDIGISQSRQMRDVTISLASFKSQQPTTHPQPLTIDWDHMRTLRQLFHPCGRLDIRFYLNGSKTATFTLGSRENIERQLDDMAEVWAERWQRTRKYSEIEARTVANLYRAEIARLFVDMPDRI